MLRTVVLLALAALSCQAYSSDSDRVTELYHAVFVGDLNTALKQTKELYNQGKGALITQAVDRLIKDSVRNTVDFAYKVWSHDGKNIVRQRFPIQFRIVLGEESAKLIFHRDNLAIKLGEGVDDMGDRIAYGDYIDKTSDRVIWKFVPQWEDNKVYFKIANVQRNQFLKLGTAVDYSGDHSVYGSSEPNTLRHQFYLHPANLNGELLFYIFNREYNQALKLARDVDSQGDRQMFSHDGVVIGSPQLWAWYISP